jgi:mannonate dehydratase
MSRRLVVLTPARKIAILGEHFGVEAAWQGPGDVSPMGHMANITMDVVIYNFGIQEYTPFSDRLKEVFGGRSVCEDSYLRPSTRPGLGLRRGVVLDASVSSAAPSPRTGKL